MEALGAGDLKIDVEIELGGGEALFDRTIVVVGDGSTLIAVHQELWENQIFLAEKINTGSKCAWPIKLATGFDQRTGRGIGMLRAVDGKLCFRIIRRSVGRVGAKRKDRIFIR